MKEIKTIYRSPKQREIHGFHYSATYKYISKIAPGTLAKSIELDSDSDSLTVAVIKYSATSHYYLPRVYTEFTRTRLALAQYPTRRPSCNSHSRKAKRHRSFYLCSRFV